MADRTHSLFIQINPCRQSALVTQDAFPVPGEELKLSLSPGCVSVVVVD